MYKPKGTSVLSSLTWQKQSPEKNKYGHIKLSL